MKILSFKAVNCGIKKSSTNELNVSKRTRVIVSFTRYKKLDDKSALELIKKILVKGESGFSHQEADVWVEKLNNICKKLGISPMNLPICEEHPGNLTREQKHKLFAEMFSPLLPPGVKSNVPSIFGNKY